MRKLMLAALIGAALVSAGGVCARPYTVDDMLADESFGRAMIDPTGRWLVFEQRDRYDTAKAFNYNTLTNWGLTRLRRVDLTAPTLRALPVAADAGQGVLLGTYSPGGTRLAVYRLQGTAWTLGIVTLATGEVTWLPVTPQEDGYGRALQWLSEREFLVIARSDGLPPLTVRRGFIAQQRLPALWAAAARGESAHTVLGSGRYASLRRRAPDSRLLRVDLETGARTVLATGEFTDLEVSPEGAHVALISAGPDIQAPGDAGVRGPRGLETEANRLQLLRLGDGRLTRPCPTCDISGRLLSWSPSGRRLLVLDRGADGLWTHGALRTVEAETGAVTEVGSGVAPRLDENPVGGWTDWMGEIPLVLGRQPGAARDDWFRLDPGGPINLTAGLPTAPDPGPRAADARRLSVLAAGAVWTVDATGRVLGRSAAGVASGRGPPSTERAGRLDRAPVKQWPVKLVAGKDARDATFDAAGLHTGRLTWDGDPVLAIGSGTAVTEDQDPRGVAKLVVLRAGRPPAAVATVNARLSDTDPVDIRAIPYRDRDRRTLTAWLWLPPGPGPHPLLMRGHQGATLSEPFLDGSGELGALLNARVLNGWGYAILWPSMPSGPDGRTKPAENITERLFAAMDAALADPVVGPRLDARRPGIIGYSLGGYTALEAITQTDRFAAAIAVSGISDLGSLWQGLTLFSQVEPEGGYSTNWRTGGVESATFRLGRPPWDVPERYIRNSPLYAADRITTPLLLLHGWQDQIPVAQSEAMYSALFRQRKDVQLVTYWGALHVFTSPGDVRDMYARMQGFLDEHIWTPVGVGADTEAPVSDPTASPASPTRGPASGGPKPRRRSGRRGRWRPRFG